MIFFNYKKKLRKLRDSNVFSACLPSTWKSTPEVYMYTGGYPSLHNSANSALTSNLVCVKEIAIKTTCGHMISIAGIIYYTCSLVIDI